MGRMIGQWDGEMSVHVEAMKAAEAAMQEWIRATAVVEPGRLVVRLGDEVVADVPPSVRGLAVP